MFSLQESQREKFKFAGLEETQPKLELLGNWMLIIFEKNMLVSEWKLLGRHEEKWEKNLIRINPQIVYFSYKTQ